MGQRNGCHSLPSTDRLSSCGNLEEEPTSYYCIFAHGSRYALLGPRDVPWIGSTFSIGVYHLRLARSSRSTFHYVSQTEL